MKTSGVVYSQLEAVAVIVNKAGKNFFDTYFLMKCICEIALFRKYLEDELSPAMNTVAKHQLENAKDHLDNVMSDWHLCAADRQILRKLSADIKYNDSKKEKR